MSVERSYVVSIEPTKTDDISIGIRAAEGYTDEMVNIGVRIGQRHWLAGHYVTVRGTGEVCIMYGFTKVWEMMGNWRIPYEVAPERIADIALETWRKDMAHLAWEHEQDQRAAEAMPY